MFKAFNLKGFDSTFIEAEHRNRLIEKGRGAVDAARTSVGNTLASIVGNAAVLDGQTIQETWFPTIEADVFLSHSHRDENDILMLAGWLYESFDLRAFVDSAIWGHASNLLRIIDNDYCRQNDGNIYSYERRNESTSHVHVILTTALGMMIHKTECLILVNTPASIAAEEVVASKTYSPWIYAELTMAGMIEEVTPNRLKAEERRIEASQGMLKEAKEKRLTILHTVRNLERLRPLNCKALTTWKSRCQARGATALDLLYELSLQ